MTTNINIKTDSELKKQAEALFAELGMNMTTAFNIFMRQAVRENRIPFEITRDPYSLEKAVSDSRNRTNLHGPFSSAADAVASMLEDQLYNIVYTNRMKRDAKLMKKRGKDMNKLVEVLNLLASGDTMPEKFKDHQLIGNLKDFRECHIEADWLLMYQIFQNELILSATATGTHSDLFDK